MIATLTKKCRTCHGRGFTPGLTVDSEWTCPDCCGTGEECGHANPPGGPNGGIGRAATDLDAAAASTPSTLNSQLSTPSRP